MYEGAALGGRTMSPSASSNLAAATKVVDPPCDRGSDVAEPARVHPAERTRGMIEHELAVVRTECDEHIAKGRLRLAGECCAELDQLIRELVACRR